MKADAVVAYLSAWLHVNGERDGQWQVPMCSSPTCLISVWSRNLIEEFGRACMC